MNRTDQLRSSGILYPHTGLINDLGGQHNIAWQIARDRRFQQSAGDLEALFAEIGDFEGKVILSSEDFESSITHPERWLPLLRFAQTKGRPLVFIIYLRSQISYLESLYREMLQHGFGEEFAAFTGEVLANGTLKMKEWEFHFDYWRIAQKLSSIAGVSVQMRNYHALFQDSPVMDFSTEVGIEPSILGEFAGLRKNTGLGLENSLTLYYRNRVQRNLESHELETVVRLCNQVKAGIAITGALRTALEQKFAVSNMRLCQNYNISTIGLLPAADDRAMGMRELSIQKIFSFETQVTLNRMVDLIANTNAADRSVLENELMGYLRAWSSWVES